MLDQKTWKEFQSTGLLWLVNTFLHTFGWTLMAQVDDDGNIIGGVPCRTDYRGFTTDINDEGYLKVTDWLKENIDMLEEDVESLRKPVVEEATSEENGKSEDKDLVNESKDDNIVEESEDDISIEESSEKEEETASED